MAHFARFAVVFAIEPLFGALHGFELKDDDPFRVPIAFEHFGLSATDGVFAAVFLNRCAGKLFVFFVADWIDNLDFDNYVGAHRRKV